MKPVDESFVTLEPNYERLSNPNQLDDDGVIALCKEVLLQMKEDYISSVKYIETHHVPDAKPYVAAEKTKKEIEQFTHSKFFHSMFDMPSERFLKILLEEPAGYNA